MRVFALLLISSTPLLSYSAESRPASISVTKIEKQKVTVSGSTNSGYELVLRAGKTGKTKELEWTSSLEGKFSAELASTNKLPLGDGKFGKGIVFKVQRADNNGATTNIAMSDLDPIPNGEVRFRPKKSTNKKVPVIKQSGTSITLADIICDDGTAIPLTVLVRQHQVTKR